MIMEVCLHAIEFELLVGAFRIKWLKLCLSNIPNSLFNKLGGLEFLMKCDFDPPKLPVKLSKFHQQIYFF